MVPASPVTGRRPHNLSIILNGPRVFRGPFSFRWSWHKDTPDRPKCHLLQSMCLWRNLSLQRHALIRAALHRRWGLACMIDSRLGDCVGVRVPQRAQTFAPFQGPSVPGICIGLSAGSSSSRLAALETGLPRTGRPYLVVHPGKLPPSATWQTHPCVAQTFAESRLLHQAR